MKNIDLQEIKRKVEFYANYQRKCANITNKDLYEKLSNMVFGMYYFEQISEADFNEINDIIQKVVFKKYYANVEVFNRRLDEFENYYEENEFDTLEEARAKFNEIDINDYQSRLCANDQKRIALNKIVFDSDGNIYDNEMAD